MQWHEAITSALARNRTMRNHALISVGIALRDAACGGAAFGYRVPDDKHRAKTQKRALSAFRAEIDRSFAAVKARCSEGGLARLQRMLDSERRRPEPASSRSPEERSASRARLEGPGRR